MSALTELPDRAAAVALHARLVRASPGQMVTPKTAAALAAAIGEDPAQLRAAWAVLGAWALRQLDRMMLTEGRARDGRRPRGRPTTPEGAARGQILEPATARSWYQRLPLWRRPVAVGNTGRRKQLGELTHGDCQTIAQFYGRSATTLREKADRWSAISRALNGAETLGSAQRKLAPATLEFLRDETGGEGAND